MWDEKEKFMMIFDATITPHDGSFLDEGVVCVYVCVRAYTSILGISLNTLPVAIIHFTRITHTYKQYVLLDTKTSVTLCELLHIIYKQYRIKLNNLEIIKIQK